MTTINDELQARNTEMTQLSNDLTNLLTSVDIPIVMVGSDARVRRFTPKARQTLNLIQTDIGRSIGEIKPAIQAPDLDRIVAEVISSLSMRELETQDKNGAWHRLQVRPYRTSDNRIDGAVISLVDINDLKQSAAALQNAHDDARTIITTMPTPALTVGFDRRVQLANDAFYILFKCGPSEVEGKSLFELGDGQWNIPSLMNALDVLFSRGTPFHDLPIAQDYPQVGRKDLLVHATATRLIGSPGTNTAAGKKG